MAKCLLKKFGILEVNKYVEYRIHPNPELLYVYFQDDWHTVPKKDCVEINGEECAENRKNSKNKGMDKPVCPDCGTDLELGVDVAGVWSRKIKKDGNLHKTINRCSGSPNGASYLFCPKCGFSYDCEHASHNILIKELDDWISAHLEEIMMGWK